MRNVARRDAYLHIGAMQGNARETYVRQCGVSVVIIIRIVVISVMTFGCGPCRLRLVPHTFERFRPTALYCVRCTHRHARSEDGRHAQRLPYRALSSLYFSSLGLYTTMPILRAEPTIPRASVRNEMCSLFIFLRSCHFTCDTQRRPLCRHASTKQDGDKRTTAQIAAQRL